MINSDLVIKQKNTKQVKSRRFSVTVNVTHYQYYACTMY